MGCASLFVWISVHLKMGLGGYLVMVSMTRPCEPFLA
jgi:hypothetical protein